MKLFAVCVFLCLYAIGGFAVYEAYHNPRRCVAFFPIPPCGEEMVCVDRSREVCYRYKDACRLPAQCKEWKGF